MDEKTRLEKNAKIKASMQATHEKRKSQVCKVFTVKIDESNLNKKQKEQLKMMFVEAKRIWNSVLNFGETNDIFEYSRDRKSVDVKQKDGTFKEFPLEFIGSQMRQSVVDRVRSSIRTLSKLKKLGYKVGRLKYRSDYDTIDLVQYPNTFCFKSSKRMRIQGVSKTVVVNGLKQFIDESNIEYAGSKLCKNAKGYYVAITCYFPKESIKKEYKPEIGIDMGCETSITCSTGEKINVQIEETERLKKLQRKLDRQTKRFTKSSNNSLKTKRLLQIEHQKIVNRKNDVANKIVARLLEHEKVYMQDEQLNNWKRNGHGKKIQHSVLGRVKAKLVVNPRVVVLDRFVATTQFCPVCNHKTKLKLSQRTYVCENCGAIEDRDAHAAKNMIVLGQMKSNLKSVGTGYTKFTPVDMKAAASKVFKTREVSFVGEAGRFSPLGES